MSGQANNRELRFEHNYGVAHAINQKYCLSREKLLSLNIEIRHPVSDFRCSKIRIDGLLQYIPRVYMGE